MAQKCKKERKKLPPSPGPPLNLKVLKRYQDLKEKGKFLDLDIKCFDELGLTFTRKVHKYVLNSLSVSLGRFFSDGKQISCPGDVLDCFVLFCFNLGFTTSLLKSNADPALPPEGGFGSPHCLTLAE